MARKSFILHIDSLEVFDKLSDEQLGKLMRAITVYQRTGALPELDLLTQVAITPFINQFNRDELAYEKVIDRNKNNGIKGGRPKNPEEPKKPTGLSGFPQEPKKPDSDSKNDSDSVSKERESRYVRPSYAPTLEEVTMQLRQSGKEKLAPHFMEENDKADWKYRDGTEIRDWQRWLNGFVNRPAKLKDGSAKPTVFVPPDIQAVREYFGEKGYTVESANKAHSYYEAANWKDGEGKQVKNWKQKMIGVWFKEENKIKKPASRFVI